MNNNLYSRHDEAMVRHEMREVDRAVEQARLLREAGLGGENAVVRAVNVLRNLLRARKNALRGQRSAGSQVYRSVND